MDTPNYTPPLDPELARKFYALDDAAQEHYQERAGIIQEACPGISRHEAEQAAWEDTLLYLERRNAAAKPP